MYSLGLINTLTTHFLHENLLSISLKERSCGNPGTPTNGKKNSTNYKYGSVISFSCDVGYNLVGSQTRTCQTNGKWTGTQPTCPSKRTDPFIFIFCKSLWIGSFVSRVWPGGPGVLVTTLSLCEPFFVTSSKTQRGGRHENLVNTWCDPPLKNPGYAPVFPFASWVNPFPIAAFKKHWFKIERVR